MIFWVNHSILFLRISFIRIYPNFQEYNLFKKGFNLLNIVIWTGSVYQINEENPEDIAHIFSKSKRQELINKYNKEISDANRILVVGGGSTGVECMGEIIDKYRDQKEYGLVNSQARLLAGFPDKASRKVLNYLEGK